MQPDRIATGARVERSLQRGTITIGTRPASEPDALFTRSSPNRRVEERPVRAGRDSAAAAVESRDRPCHGTLLQPLSGSKLAIARAFSAVCSPRSFWKTTPAWLTWKVIIPEFAYSAG